MKKRLVVTLEVTTADMPPEELEECAQLEGVEVKDLWRLKDMKADDLGWVIAESMEGLGPQFFEGTGMYAKFIGGRLLKAQFRELPTKQRRRKG